MKLPSLHIQNYRNLKDLKINSLGRINLITGKNNTGKTAILEAISIYASKGNMGLIYELLDERGENYGKQSGTTIESTIKSLSSLFSDRLINWETNFSIFIGEFGYNLFDETIAQNNNNLSMRFVKYIENISKIGDEITTRNRRIVTSNIADVDNISDDGDYKIGFEIRIGESTNLVPIERFNVYNKLSLRRFEENKTFQLIKSRNIDKNTNSILWDKITLTYKETFIIDALKIIEPNVERIAFITDENSKERNAVIKLKNNDKIVPLKSMGDGINRILTIILALVNADNGFLLIDEFENGLHYSVQENIWKIIFSLSEKLNIQVFATTHSEDCIAGFEKVLNQQVNPLDGKLIRLDDKNGTIREVDFSANELKIAIERGIEVR
jgi:AAA15 family ATPase/GTPase